MHPDTRRLDSFFGEARAGINNWGVAFDDWGQLFHKCAANTQAFHSVAGLTRAREWLYGMPEIWGGGSVLA